MNPQYIFYAILIGIIPAILWLMFWLKEDNKKPEPKSIIIVSFLAGMLAAPLTLITQLGLQSLFPDASFVFFGVSIGYYVILFVIVEELFKLGASYFALKSRFDDEPIDAMIYLITASLGFVAVENTLYALKALTESGIDGSIEAGIMRFIGPSLLHIVTSGIVGLSISLSFYIHGATKRLYILLGLFTAIALHTFFNLFIIVSEQRFGVLVFSSVWILAIVLLISFEIVKKIKR